MKRSPKIAFIVSTSFLLVLAACGSDEQALRPIEFSLDQASRSAAANEATGGAPTADSKMSLAPYSVEYEIAGDLPALDDSAQSWRAVGQASKSTMEKIVTALGVDAALKARPKDQGGGYVAGPTDGSKPSVTFNTDAYASWYYSAAWSTGSKGSSPGSVATEPAVAPDAPVSSDASVPTTGEVVPDTIPAPQNLPSKDTARTRAQEILDAAGVDVRDEDIEVYADDWSVSVTATPRVGGMRIPMQWNVGFGDNGVITWAGGNLLTFEKGPKYPRVGTTDGVKRLNDPQFSAIFGYGGPRGIASDMARSATAESPTNDTAAPAQVQKIRITGVKESLSTILDNDDVLWLVPSYEYTTQDGYTVSVVAIADDYVKQVTPTTNDVQPSPGVVDEGSSTGGGSTGSSQGSSAGDDALALTMDEAQKLIGLSEDEAAKVADANGWIVRVGSRDGESMQLTMDFVTNRVNLDIVDGKVTGVSLG